MTKENAHLFLPLVQALAEGKTIQHFVWDVWKDMDRPTFGADVYTYRIKPTVAPLDPEDVPLGSIIREKGTNNWSMVTCCQSDPYHGGLNQITWGSLKDRYEIKRPGEDWKPCSK
jgi:hypothetical protein